MRSFVLAAVFASTVSPSPAQSSNPPSAQEQAALIAKVRERALDYSRSLSDFLCTQVTRRYSAKPENAKDASQPPSWKLVDTVTIRVSYFKQKEDYRVVKVDEKPVNKSLNQVGGHWTEGEFGSFLDGVFVPRNNAQFNWARWSTINSNPAAVLSFRIEQANSTFETTARRMLHVEKFNWGVEGELAVDPATGQALTVAFHAIDIPPQRPLKELRVFIAYGYRKIGDVEFLLPVRSESLIDIYGRLVKAETEFSDYRKFSSDSDIKFETPEK